jgi:hypothetical protein
MHTVNNGQQTEWNARCTNTLKNIKTKINVTSHTREHVM